jgi:hypothetical protein
VSELVAVDLNSIKLYCKDLIMVSKDEKCGCV